MLGRGVCAAALVIWLAALVGLRAATSDVTRSDVVLDGGTPGALYLPRTIPDSALPVAVLAHDFAGDSASLGAMELSKVARQIQADAKLEMRDAFINLPLLLQQAQAAMEMLARRYGPP